MDRYRGVIVVSLLLTTGVSASCLAQSAGLTEDPIWAACPQLPYLPESDSVARWATVDSVAAQLTSRWGLVEISSGWGPNYVPARSVEITINSRQQGLVIENGIEVAAFQLTLIRRWSSIWFKISQQGQSIFHFPAFSSRQWGLIKVCNQKLIISDAAGDGTAFAFRHIPDNAPVPPVNQHTVTALLNYVPWSGSVQAMRAPITPDKPGSANRITLYFTTGQPYADYPAHRRAGSTTAANQLPVMQQLRVSNVALAVGRYEIRMLTDSTISATDARFELIAGDRILDTWNPQNAGSGWMEITRYDPATKTAVGVFDFYLISSTSKTAYFQDGSFTVKLTE